MRMHGDIEMRAFPINRECPRYTDCDSHATQQEFIYAARLRTHWCPVLCHVAPWQINMTLPLLPASLKLNYWYSATKSSCSGCQYSLGIITGLIKPVIYRLLSWHSTYLHLPQTRERGSSKNMKVCDFSLKLSFSQVSQHRPVAFQSVVLHVTVRHDTYNFFFIYI